jgi:Protein kinase domain
MTSAATQRRVGRYEILQEVGRGGTAVVYLARQADLDRNVALKELAGPRASDPAFIERFLRESRVAGSLNHPNIVTVHEYFEHDGTAYIAMEYFERGSLRGSLAALTTAQVAGVLEGILAGLAHAHGRGIVHRDLKPENVMVTSNDGVKIADFGIAKVLQEEVGDPLTISGTTLGTPAYMAPEQALAMKVGPSVDLYAVGVLAYEMLSGDVPFRGSDVAMAIMLQHLNEPAPPLRAANPDLDPALSAWVERLLAKAPEQRPPSAAEAWDDLDETVIRIAGPRWRRQSRLTASPVAAAVPSTATSATQQLQSRGELPGRRRRVVRRGVVAVLAAVLIAGGAAAAMGLARDGDHAVAPPSQTSGSTTTGARSSTAARTFLRRVALASGDPVTARLRLTGPPLDAGSIRVRDGDISDGHAWFELVQPGIGARTQGAASDDVGVRVRKAKNRLRVDLAVVEHFERMRVQRVDGRTVLVTLTKPSVPVATGSSSVTQPTGPTDTTPTKPTKPAQEKPWTSG